MASRPQKLAQVIPTLRRFRDRFRPELARQRAVIGGAFAALLAQVAFRLLEPWPLGIVLDHVLSESVGPATGALAKLEPLELLALAAVGVLVIATMRAATAYISAVGFALAGNRVAADVRNALYRHLQALSLRFHARARGGDLVVRVIGDVGIVRDVTVTAFLPLLGNVLILIGMFSVMLWMNGRLALIAACTVPLLWFTTAKLGRRIQNVARVQRQREGDLANTAAESLGAIETVQALSLGDDFAAAFEQHATGSLNEGVKGKRLSARLERSVDVIAALATALVLWFGARAVLSGSLRAGELVVFLTYLKGAFRPLRGFAKYAARLAKASAAAERVLEILDRDADVADRRNAQPAPPLSGNIRFEHAAFAYHPGRPVLQDVDFEIAPGTHVALVGASGSGKSTLAAAMLRLHDPCAGRVSMDGVDLRDFTLASLRRQIAFVPQDTLLFAATIGENIALGAPGADLDAVREAARQANAAEFIERLPDGYDSAVGERGVDLSAGQRQRIAIARMVIGDARIVILDEPLTGLDRENDRLVADAMERCTRGRTTLLITHDLEHAATCDSIVVLERQRVAEIGSHAELLAANGPYAALGRARHSTRPPSEATERNLALTR